MTEEVVGGWLRWTVSDGVARLVLAGPRPGNAMGLAGARELLDAARAVAAAPGLRVIDVRAQGPVFCVGGDLQELGGVPDVEAHVARTVETAHEALVALRGVGVPVVTSVQGVAAGAGIGIALLGDVVLLARSARMRVAYTAAGLTPDCGVSWVLARALGPARAMDLVLTNRVVTAEDAESWGLVSRVVDDDALSATADAVVAGLATGSASALASARRLVLDAPHRRWEDHLQAEAAAVVRAAGADGREGVAAFLAGRAPSFAGGPPYGGADPGRVGEQ